ncbi:MAG TPA: OsmC family protein [Pyrinomonadaceae bacterium]|nr:OsmC family protein [Pyrinomonadaceae bacterium]
MDLRSIQKPLKEKYRSDPASSRITLKASGGQGDLPIACSVEVGEKVLDAQAHAGVGGAGTAACSGDLLLAALAACAQLTCQLVATAMGIPIEHISVEVEGDLDLSGTLGISKDVGVGFNDIRARFDIRAPSATREQLTALQEKTEQYCVVMQTLLQPPTISTNWVFGDGVINAVPFAGP